MNRKRDKNEKEIVKILTVFGARVYRIESKYDPGCPDLLVFYHDKVFAFEVKSEGGVVSHEQACNTAVRIVRTPTEALRALEINI